MKHGKLRSIAHNLADSLAGYVSLITGVYDLDLYKDAGQSPNGELVIDFLNNKIISGNPSPNLIKAVSRLQPEFNRLCESEKVSRINFRNAKAHFYANEIRCGFTIIVEDNNGKITETDYSGIPAQRVFQLDSQGRRRRKPIRFL